MMPDEHMMKWFYISHLADKSARGVAKAYQELAEYTITVLDPGPERTVALRKLLEARDAAVRAVIHPGG